MTSPGSYIYVQGRPRIGIPVTFFNDGAHAGVINSGSLVVNDGSNTFKFELALVALSVEKWIDEGGKIRPVPAPLSLFSPIAVRAGDAAEAVFWYSSRTDFRFKADTNYRADLTFSRKSAEDGKITELSSATVIFHIDSLTADNAARNPETPIPLTTGWPGNL